MAAKYLHYTYDQLNTFCMDAFQKFGFSESEARIISDVLLLSDLYGIESHGMQRLVRYHKGIEKGMIDVHAKPEIVHETPVSAVIDAHDAMGQLVSHQAMELAIAKAKRPAWRSCPFVIPIISALPVTMPKWPAIRAWSAWR